MSAGVTAYRVVAVFWNAWCLCIVVGARGERIGSGSERVKIKAAGCHYRCWGDFDQFCKGRHRRWRGRGREVDKLRDCLRICEQNKTLVWVSNFHRLRSCWSYATCGPLLGITSCHVKTQGVCWRRVRAKGLKSRAWDYRTSTGSHRRCRTKPFGAPRECRSCRLRTRKPVRKRSRLSDAACSRGVRIL